MRNQLPTLLCCFLCLAAFGQSGEEKIQPPVNAKADPARPQQEVYRYCDVQPEFPGGLDSLRAYLARNIVYPQRLREEDYKGRSFVQFTVRKTGELTDIRIQRPAPNCPECDAELIRVIRSMPKWIPGKIRENAVDSQFTLPVTFMSQ